MSAIDGFPAVASLRLPSAPSPELLADQTRDPTLGHEGTTTAARVAAALGSRYVIEREIGRGGAATVFLARDLRHQSAVALKVLHPELTPLLAGERFAREIRITAGLQHPNILPVLDSGDAGGLPYYAMPYVEGESLAHRLAREPHLPIPDALRIAREVARTLAFAHERGFVHRDIKPSNILLSHGHAIVADFGIARAIDAAAGERITESGLAIGTALYMSPEQSAGAEVDGRTDVYSLGCVLYEMLAGAPPFSGPTPHAIMARHAVDPVPSVRTVRGTVSPALEATIAQALAKVNTDRFADAGKFADALEAAERMPITHPVSIATGAVSGTTRSRTRLIAGLAVALLAVIGAFSVVRMLGADRTLDRHRITVFPLSVSPGFKGSPAIGEDIATVIGHSLDGTGSLRWIDGWRLTASASDARAADGRIVPDVARKLARSQRSGFYLSGRVVEHGDSVDVLVELTDVAGDSIVKQSRASGTEADAWRTGLRSVNGILPALVPGAAARDLASEWADRSPEALAHFLLGEASFRRARAAEALTHYREAVRLDSTFALAAVRGAQAATWEHRASEADSLIRHAIRLPMSPRFTHYARGYVAYLDGSPDSAAREFRAALATDPEMAVAWMQLGETYTHLVPVAGRVDTLAEAAFREAIRLDSSAAHMLFHPIEARLRRGRAAEAEPLIRAFLAAGADTILAAQVRVMHDCVANGKGSVQWKNEVLAHPNAVLFAAASLAAGGSQLDCSEAAYVAERTFETPEMAATDAAADSRRWAALVGLTGILIAEARTAEAIARVDSALARKEGGASIYLVGSAFVPALANHAGDIGRQMVSQSGTACEKCTPDRMWQLGVWSFAAKDTATLRALRDNLATRARGGPWATGVVAGATSAKLTLARGDTATALRELAAALDAPTPNASGNLIWTESLGRGPERLAYSRLLMARRDFRRAIEVADTFDSPASQSYIAYLPASLALRAQAADSAGSSALANVYRRRLDGLKSHPRQH